MAELVDAGDTNGALAASREFHHTLCTTRVLDPACGTGNFLYVALELMKRLEGEVLEYVERLGGQAALQLAGETVDPSQFLGLELNPRAAAIAEVVLWVGYLKWQLRTGGLQAIPEPVLKAHGNIRQRPNVRMVIDLYGLTAEDVRDRFPATYAHVLDHVKPHRDHNNRTAFRERWWVFGEPRKLMRSFLAGVPRFIATTETTKHRLFRLLPVSILPDHMVVAIGLADAAALALLSSRAHVHWAIQAGGWLGVGNDPRYSKTKTFDPFPFPALLTDPALDAHGAALLDRLRDMGERLERMREDRLAADGKLTLTGLYNRLERRREALHGGTRLRDEEREDHARHQVPLLMDLHDDIDRAALHAWGWGDLTDALVGRPGATVPSDRKAPEQEAAEDELLSRLVALNRERREEEARGQVRWLRPAYQVPKLKGRVPEGEQAALQVEAPAGLPEPRPWPTAPLAQLSETRALLSEADGPLSADALARSFTGRVTAKRRERVEEVLAALSDLGLVRHEGGTGYLARR